MYNDESHLLGWPGPFCWTQTQTLTVPPSAGEGTFFFSRFVLGVIYNHSLTVTAFHTHNHRHKQLSLPITRWQSWTWNKNLKKINWFVWLTTAAGSPSNPCSFKIWMIMKIHFIVCDINMLAALTFTERRFERNCCQLRTVLNTTNAKANVDRMYRGLTSVGWLNVSGLPVASTARSWPPPYLQREKLSFSQTPIAFVRQNYI